MNTQTGWELSEVIEPLWMGIYGEDQEVLTYRPRTETDNACLTTGSQSFYLELGNYVLCSTEPTQPTIDTVAERQADALDEIAGAVSLMQEDVTELLTRISVALERLVGQMESRL